jgi:hypothetical protein
MCGAREFNGENCALKVDYLVNVLRSFLMATGAQASRERARMAPVLCQVLHLSAEDTRAIVREWEALATPPEGLGSRLGGFVGGWLSGPARGVAQDDEGEGERDGDKSIHVTSDMVDGHESAILPFS